MSFTRGHILTLAVAIAFAMATGVFLWKRESSGPIPASDDLPTTGSTTASPLDRGRTTSTGTTHVRLADEFALKPGETVPLVSSWSDLLQKLSPSDRALAHKLASRYPEAYSFSTAEQLRWMIERGYPMPSEYVEAAAMDFDQLLAHARSGNSKAAMLAYDRLLESVSVGTQPTDANVRFAELERTLMRQCSPFRFYLMSRRYEDRSATRPGAQQTDDLVAAVAAYSVAAALGDHRVNRTAQRITEGLSMSPRTQSEAMQMAALHRGSVRSDCPMTPMPP